MKSNQVTPLPPAKGESSSGKTPALLDSTPAPSPKLKPTLPPLPSGAFTNNSSVGGASPDVVPGGPTTDPAHAATAHGSSLKASGSQHHLLTNPFSHDPSADMTLNPSTMHSMAHQKHDALDTAFLRAKSISGGQTPENYIPFRLADMRETLFKNYEKVFHNQEVKSQFFKLCKWLSLRNSTRLAIVFDDVYDNYSFIDPDNDLLNPDNDPDNPGAPVPGRLSDEQKEGYMKKFRQLFEAVLDKGDFEPVTEEFIENAYSGQDSAGGGFMGTGMEVKRVNTDIIDYKLWFRTKEEKTLTYRSWRTLFVRKTVVLSQFDRLVVLYRKRPQEEIERRQALHPLSWYEKTKTKMMHFLFNMKELSDTNFDGGELYLKVFKDVLHTDIDMLLPGAEVKFSWLDYLIIWGSMAFAIGSATYKIASGTMSFESMMNILTSVVLIIMPLYGAFRGYMSIKEKMQDLQFRLNQLFIRHNLSSNTGVIATVLDEAQEQEDKEAILAYFFLWKGLKTPVPVSKEQLDADVEAFLNGMIRDAKLTMCLDFEVVDAIDKLERMGMLEEEEVNGQRMFKVLPLDEAVEAAHINKFNEAREAMGLKKRKMRLGSGVSGSDAPLWQECMGTFPATGQRFRYFFNMETGESTYNVPGMYAPLLDPLFEPPPAQQAQNGSVARSPGPAPVASGRVTVSASGKAE